MTHAEKLRDVARVYRAHGEACARARLVFYGWSADNAPLLESLLAIAGELAERMLPAQQEAA